MKTVVLVYFPVITPGVGTQIQYFDGAAKAWVTTSHFGVFPDYDAAKVKVDELNLELGMNPQEAFSMVERCAVVTGKKS